MYIGRHEGPVLAIDPSSKCCGFAFGTPRGMGVNIRFTGKIQPKKRLIANDRIREMCQHFQNITNYYDPALIVIESPSGKVHGRFGKTKVPALAIYGMAVGAIWATCLYSRNIHPDRVHLVNANEWTAGKSKDDRRIRANALWKPYSVKKDPGGDISDAICLLDWFCRHMEIERIKKS